MNLPDNFEVKFIMTEKGVEDLLSLLGSEYIGLDTEWRPQIIKFSK